MTPADLARRASDPSEAQSAAVLNALSVHVAVIDEDGTIVVVNDAWRRFAEANGAPGHPSLVEGANYLVSSADAGDPDACAANAGVRDVLAGRLDEFLFEYPCHSPSELQWFELRATPLQPGTPGGAVIVHSTITERKLAEERLRHLADHDELTGLANRRRLMEVLADTQPSGRLGVIMLDLDHFKSVNDTHGHGAGNEVLCAVAAALDEAVPGGSVAGRHGGDEFCVALLAADAGSLIDVTATITSRARARLDALVFAQDVTLSMGATIVAVDEPLAMAMERADRALYAVKRAGRDGCSIA